MGLTQNPIFADPQLEDYSSLVDPKAFALRSSSPAIDTGLSLGYTTDFSGMPIPQKVGADIGAFEFMDKVPHLMIR
jgi:hypothetical protein